MQLTEIDKPEAIESLLSWVSSISVSLAPIYTLEQLATSTHIAELLLMIEPERYL
jgi:hypothetical protein